MTDTPPLDLLLQVQEHDSALTRLRHQHSQLPQHEATKRAIAAHDTAVIAVAELEARVVRIAADQHTREKELADLESRLATGQQRLYETTAVDARELQAREAELATLRMHRSDVEDEILAGMEENEQTEAELVAARGQATLNEEVLATARAELDAAAAEVDAQIAEQVAAREIAVAGIDDELLATYERHRKQGGGIGVARLVGDTCGGCHLSMSAVEVDRLRTLPADELATCEECGRLLVR
jgi:predicted  nucleic acid-binding Zn-ribbon protein